MGNGRLKTRLVALLVYGFSVVMPLAHSSLELGATQRGCTDERGDGAVLSAPCQNPCNDPAHHLEDYLRDNIDQGEQLFPLQPYDILVFERGLAQKIIVADRIE